MVSCLQTPLEYDELKTLTISTPWVYKMDAVCLLQFSLSQTRIAVNSFDFSNSAYFCHSC